MTRLRKWLIRLRILAWYGAEWDDAIRQIHDLPEREHSHVL